MINRLKLFIGTGLGIGFIPFAPGTFGSITVLPVVYFVPDKWRILVLSSIVIVASLLTFWVNSFFEREYEKDPAILVTDEWAGQVLAFLGLCIWGSGGINFAVLVTGFILFRLFDILKPLGVNKVQELPHGWGVLADDLLAGFYAFLCLKTITFVWPHFL